MKFGTIRDIQMRSPLESMASVRPKVSSTTLRAVVAPLMLTSLVDAFAVIVIYLLVSTHQGPEALDIEKEIKLPVASQTHMLQAGVNLRIVKGEYFINDEKMNAGELLAHLQELGQKLKDESDPREGKLVIQADKDSTYKALSPILSVASQSGFDKIKFATLEE